MWFWDVVLLTLAVLAVVVPLRARAHDDRLWSIAERTLVWAALGWVVGVTIYLALVPIYEGVIYEDVASVPEEGANAERITTARRTLLDVNGIGVLVPIVLTVLPLFRARSATRHRLEMAGAILLLVFVVGGALSIGLFYAPGAMAMLLAAALATAGPHDNKAGKDSV